MDIALDIETLSLSTNCVIVNVGAVYFDPEVVDSFEDLSNRAIVLPFDRILQVEAGRHTSQDTLEWWEKQSSEAKRQLDRPGSHPKVIAEILRTYMYNHGNKHSRWYCRGSHFDVARLESLFELFDTVPPWHYRKPRCSRTVLDEWGITDDMLVQRPENMIPHNSGSDAAFEAFMMQRVRNGVPLEIRK